MRRLKGDPNTQHAYKVSLELRPWRSCPKLAVFWFDACGVPLAELIVAPRVDELIQVERSLLRMPSHSGRLTCLSVNGRPHGQ